MRVEASNRSLEFHQLCHPHGIQNGDSIFDLRSHQEERCDVLIDLKDAYFHIPILPDSQPYLFIALNGKTVPIQGSLFWPLSSI